MFVLIDSDRRSHVGDGNFHCGLIFLPEDFEKVDAAAHRMVDRAIALDGTCTGQSMFELVVLAISADVCEL